MYSVNVIFNTFLILLAAGRLTQATKAMRFSHSYQDRLKVMSALIDDFYDPCEDFFQHACGSYDPQVAPVAPFMYNKEEAVRFFENNRANFSTTGGLLLNGLYESCKEKSWNLSQWKEIDFLNEFAKWPYLHYQWEEAGIQTSWQHLAAQLVARGIPIFFDIFFAENTIYASPADVSCPASQESIKAIIMSPATSVVNQQIADIISSELWYFCMELAGDFPTSDEKPGDDLGLFTTSEFFDKLFQTLSITEEDIELSRKITIRIERLSEIMAVVRRTSPRIVINFIIWKMLEALNYEDCFQLTDEFDPFLLSEYWNWNIFERQLSKQVAFASFLFHITRFQKRRKDKLVPEDWEAFLDRSIPRRDLNIDRVIKNYANTQLSPDVFASDYSGIEMQRGHFYLNYFNLKARQLRMSFVKDNYVDKEDPNHPLYFLRKFLNFVILAQSQPLFHYFSTEGFDLWYQSGFLTNTDDLYSAIDCLGRQSQVYLDDYPIFANFTVEQMEEALKFNRAFHESFNDYFFWLESEKFAFAEDYVLEYFGLNSSRVMFYSVAQLYCGRNNAHYSTIINRSFMNTAVFQDAFECDLETPMNPSMKCICRKC